MRPRAQAGILALATAAFALLALAPAAQAGKVVDRVVAGTTTTGTTGGLFNTPRGIAVNHANVNDANGTEGWTYVVDDNNHRIQAFNADDVFQWAIGRDVIASGKAGDLGTAVMEKCTVAADCKAGSFGTTADGPTGEFDNPQGIAINQSTGDFYVRDRDNRRVQQFSADGDFIRMWGHDVIVAGKANDNGTGFEICDVTNGNDPADCKVGTTGAAGGQFATSSTASTGIDVVPAGAPNAGNVIVADPTNRRVQEFEADGTWVRAWGWDVVVPGGTGEVLTPINEQQLVKIGNGSAFIDGGTYTLTFDGDTTVPLPPGATTADVQAALEALPSIGAGNVVVTGPTVQTGNVVWIERHVEFVGDLELSDQPAITGDGSELVMRFGAPATVNTTTVAPGGPQPDFEICTVAAECKAAAPSAPVDRNGAFAVNQPVHVAVDSGGTVYGSDTAPTVPTGVGSQTASQNRVQRFDSAGDLLLDAINVVALTSTPTNQPTTGLAVDPDTDNLLVARSASIGVLELSDPDGTPSEADRHYQGSGLTPNGIALDGAGEDLYLSSSSGGHRVFAADDDGAPAAIVEISPPTELEAHSATFTGTVNPNSVLPTSYRFQYSRNGVTWTDVAPAADLGAGEGPIAVEDEVTGLEANTFYRVRILTSKPFGNADSISPELVFLTDAVGPAVKTFHPQARTATTARLGGSINPNNLPTSYHFEYGKTTKYGSKAPVPDGSVSGGTDKVVLADISGLTPDTTYHVRLVATNAEGTTFGDDITFVTRSADAPSGGRAYEMVTPPFKATRANVVLGRSEFNVNPGVASLSGDVVGWRTTIFPLTEDVGAPANGDNRIIRRTPSGWVHRTFNTVAAADYPWGSTISGVGSTAEFDTIGVYTRDSLKVPHTGSAVLQDYVYREGIGTKGYTPWTDDTDATQGKFGLTGGGLNQMSHPTLFNDQGTALARAGESRDLAEDPDLPGDQDPTGEQQLPGSAFGGPFGGRTVYLQRSADPDVLPIAAKELVSECSGSAGDATGIPARIGTGAATDTIGAQPCTESDGMPDATGTGTVSTGSAVVSDLTTDSGAFAPGQIVSSPDIPIGTRIVSVGSETLTLSAPLTAKASFFASTTEGSTEISVAFGQIGGSAPGDPISGPGIPAGTTIVSIDGIVLTLSNAATETSPFAQVVVAPPGPDIELTATAQHITSQRGAALGGGGVAGNAPLIGALSNDGARVFFSSPDPAANGVPSSCAAGTDAATSCPPQLFVRQYDGNGENPQVRWISRSRSSAVGDGSYEGAMIAGQRIALMGTGALYQGAARDGSVVYFKTTAPLTPDDPNAGASITTGAAQVNSWDLYRYELPTNLADDPADGKLTRISGGPDGNADANAFGGLANNKVSSPLRFLSDDGHRAYFVTRAPIAGADDTPPSGGVTEPGGTVTDNNTRNLYLYDANRSGADRYSFIARIPAAGNWNHCAAVSANVGRQTDTHSSTGIARDTDKNCVRGTRDGSHIVFSTRGQLGQDDDDDVADLYLYDAGADELTRVTAPRPGAEPYVCEDGAGQFSDSSVPLSHCHGNFSYRGSSEAIVGDGETSRGWGGMRNEHIAKDADGVASVFFESRSQLVPEDTNGDRYDVYEWREGDLSLISPGKSNDNAWYSGNSDDGSSVFFVTTEAIDPREIDSQDFDIYAARKGGGFPYTPPPTPCDVLAFQCEGEAIAGAAARGSATNGFAGEGNVRPTAARCNKKQVQRGKRCVAKKALARRACAKRKGKAKRRCVRNQVQRLTKVQQRQNKANKTGRASR